MKRLTAIRNEANPRRKLRRLANAYPGIGTPLEPFFAECQTALELDKVKTGPAAELARQGFEAIGRRLAENVMAAKWWNLQKLTTATRLWAESKHRRPSARDIVRSVLVEMATLFPPGWKRNWKTIDPKTGRVIRRGLPASVRETIAVRDVLRNVHGTEMDDKELRRTIQLVAREMGIALDASQYTRPTTKTQNKVH